MTKIIATLSPDQLFSMAVEQAGPDLSPGGLRLLTSGMIALHEMREKNDDLFRQKALHCLISYVARTGKMAEQTVLSMTVAMLGVAELRALSSAKFQQAVDYLLAMTAAPPARI